MKTANESIFTLDCIEGKFNGFTTGELWNGFACPLFELGTAIEIIKKICEYEGLSYNYDLSGLITLTDGINVDNFEPTQYLTNKGIIFLYSFDGFTFVDESTKYDF